MALLRSFDRHIVILLYSVMFFKRLNTSKLIMDEKQADSFSKYLRQFAENVTAYSKLKERFIAAPGKFTKIDGSKLVIDYTQKLEKKFDDKKKRLKLVKEQAEKSKKQPKAETVHEYDSSKLKEVNYYPYSNMRVTTNTSLEINPIFSLDVKVNMTESFVHVPTNIYAKSKNVLEIVRWTSSLDPVFKENFNKSQKKLLYQYYGDHSGIYLYLLTYLFMHLFIHYSFTDLQFFLGPDKLDD